MDIQEKDEEDEEEKSLSNDKNDQNVPNQNVPNDRKIPPSIIFNHLFDPFIFSQMNQYQHHSSERTSKNSTKLILRDRRLNPSTEEQIQLTNLFMKVHFILDNMYEMNTSLKTFTLIQDVGSYRTKTLINIKPMIVDIVALYPKVLSYTKFDKIVQHFKELIVYNNSEQKSKLHIEIDRPDASFMFHDVTINPNIRVRILVGMDYQRIGNKWKTNDDQVPKHIMDRRIEAIQQTEWFLFQMNRIMNDNSNLSNDTIVNNIHSLIRLMKDVRHRFRPQLDPLSPWIITPIALYCCSERPPNYPYDYIPLYQSFMRLFGLISTGCLMTDCNFFLDPCRVRETNQIQRSEYIQSRLTLREMDQITQTIQHLLRLVDYEDNMERIIGTVSGGIDLTQIYRSNNVSVKPSIDVITSMQVSLTDNNYLDS
ncbi:Interleukin enhancer-binding factor 2 [Blomia tropicalis]|nr:Interleukin enhancer-binding factor 2 [Blomia tropicalis]